MRVPKAMIKKTAEPKHRGKPYPDRIFRGRILALVRKNGNCRPSEIGPAIDPDFQNKQDRIWINAMIERMEKDGLIKKSRGMIVLA